MKTSLATRTRQGLRQALRLRHNVGTAERWASLLGGGAAVTVGVRRRGVAGTLLGLLGGLLLFRGLSGHCPLYGRLRLSTARPGERSGLWGSNLVHVQTRVAVQRPRDTVYGYWRDLENLPRFMRHIRDIRVDGNRSRWVARTPLGRPLIWHAQVTQDSPNERLTWRSVADSDLDTRGEVRFRPTIDGGTEIDVDMYYRPPGGATSYLLARLLGGISEKAVRRDIERFKGFIEAQSPQMPRRMTLDQGLGSEPVTPAHG